MEFEGSAMADSCIASGGSARIGRLGRKVVDYDDTKEYKSKNLFAERKRRRKLSDRLLALRSMVPIITNMNKATIIEDAITYIQELQKNVKHLSDQLDEMDESLEEAFKTESNENDPAHEMKQFGIMEEVMVSYVDETKQWIKIILEKKRGRFTRLIEAMTYLGLQLTDTNLTSYKGAILVSSCVEGTYGDPPTVQQTKELLLEIIRGI